MHLVQQNMCRTAVARRPAIRTISGENGRILSVTDWSLFTQWAIKGATRSAGEPTMPLSPTPDQSATSRTNGARSRGPTTPEGRARSALNALPPGPRLLHVRFLEGEDPVLLENLRRSRLRAFQPEDADELAAVEAMVRAEWHLIRLDRLLDTQVAGRSAEEFLRAVIGGRWGRDVMEHLGRWRERGERSLDRAHRRFLRRRQARRKGLVEGAAEPADLPMPAANQNAGEATAAARAGGHGRGEPEPPPAVAAA
jgi:hypothetical protein